MKIGAVGTDEYRKMTMELVRSIRRMMALVMLVALAGALGGGCRKKSGGAVDLTDPKLTVASLHKALVDGSAGDAQKCVGADAQQQQSIAMVVKWVRIRAQFAAAMKGAFPDDADRLVAYLPDYLAQFDPGDLGKVVVNGDKATIERRSFAHGLALVDAGGDWRVDLSAYPKGDKTMGDALRALVEEPSQTDDMFGKIDVLTGEIKAGKYNTSGLVAKQMMYDMGGQDDQTSGDNSGG